MYIISTLIAIPTVTLHPKGAVVHAGTGYIDMNCSAVGHSTLMYHWEKYNANSSEWSSLPTNQQSYSSGISTYRLKTLKKSDDGIYRCAATNIDGSGYSKTTTITVYGVLYFNHCDIHTVYNYMHNYRSAYD